MAYFPAKFAALVLAGLSYTALGTTARVLQADHSDLDQLLRQTRWVAYAPTGFNPDTSPATLPGADSIRVDLKLLRSAGFDGVITYGVDLPSVVEIAKQEGFSAMLLGIWNPSSQEEISLGINLSKDSFVKGVIVGNEGLTFHRYDAETLRLAIEQVRRETGKPVSTTEVLEVFYTNPDLVAWSDFLTINAHPYFHGHYNPVRAVDWTLGAWDRITIHVKNKPILFKEVGLPTAGGIENSEQYQRTFYFLLLTTTDVPFAFFEAFDQLFKPGDLEKSWGIFRSDRSPKPAAGVLLDPESCLGPLMRSWCVR